MANTLDHKTDADCTLDENDMCIVCHVYHGEPCPECGGRGYHKDGCKEILKWANMIT